MPYITAREDAGLSPDQTASAADSYVPAGKQLGVDWIRPIGDGKLATVCLAGRYTYPGGTVPLEKGMVRYLNPARFQIPEDAWERAEPSSASSIPATSPPSAPQPATPIPPATQPSGALLPPELAALTHHYEGCRLEAYVDPKTKAEPITIGWGSTFHKDGSKIRLGETITQAEADELYEFICHQRFWKVLERQIPFWTEMNNKQRSALCSFAYNLGPDFYGGKHFNTITANLRDRNWAAVPGSLMMYRNPLERHVVVGLGRRRRAEGLVWIGAEPADAVRQAEREINSAEDAERWEQQLRNNPPSLAGSTAKFSPGPSPASDLQLQDVLERDLKIGVEEIPQYPSLVTQIQLRLIALQLLEPPTGGFGPKSAAALKTFQKLMKSGEENVLGKATAKLLIETSLNELPQPTLDLSGGDLPAKKMAPTANPLTVNYQSQLDNAGGSGYRECFSSSCAMLAIYWAKVKNDDEYNRIRARFGDSTSAQAQLSALRSLGLEANYRTNGNKAKLQQEIDAGRPVAVGWLHHGSASNPSGGGHWTVVIGTTPTATIHNDPNGEANLMAGGYTPNRNGASQVYSDKNWQPRWQVDGPGTGWFLTVKKPG
jgi:GH24 family phage-related lysozyme (muramidase)